MASKSTVYFLGAGASKDAGVPLTDMLLRKMAARIRNLKKGKRKLKPATKQLNEFVIRFGFLNNTSSSRAPIVDAISFLDMSIRDNRALDKAFTVDVLRSIRTELIVQLSEVIHGPKQAGQLVKMTKDSEEQPGAKGRRIARHFRQFARSLRPRNRAKRGRLGQGDAIITTNYDTNVDVALYELVYWEESTGEEDYSQIWDVYLGSEFRDPYSDKDAMTDPSQVVDLLKLHGSLNWLYCPRCSRIYIAAFGSSVRYLDSRNRYEKTCDCDYYSLEPVLVAPSTFQEITNPHLQAIWLNAYHVLENADTWIFVGYSLPPEDLAIRSLLYRAADGRKGKNRKAPEIIVVNPAKAEVKARYTGLLGKNVRSDGRAFRDYCSSLAPV